MTQNNFSDPNEETPNGKTGNQEPLAANEATGNEPKPQEPKQILIGSLEVVKSAIYRFHLTGEVQISDWSPLLPNPNNPNEVISIFVGHMTVQQTLN